MPASKRYHLESVSRACAVLKAFANDAGMLPPDAVVERTELGKTVIFRLLRTAVLPVGQFADAWDPQRPWHGN